jgi:ERCC4-related helicase
VVEHLESLIELADGAVAQDPKLDQLVTQISAIREEEPKANVLVYTEYVDSQQAAVKAIKGG